ncbi:asparagine synthase (glutamine-hydrolyzing) [bacterium]|nr:asparagine synthase (glutamine-hydrolyzing) [bacterium]
MCGICGVVRWDGQPVSQGLIEEMLATLSHRGPDGSGIFQEGSVGLGHHRLAVLDLTPASAQPMGSQVRLVYNGEIYNQSELRQELRHQGYSFHSRGDVELVLNAYLAWGAGCLSRLNGMFAFACWDGRQQTLFLARDRYGVKPLYYHLGQGRLAFSSEIKSLLRLPDLRARVNLHTLHQYFTFQNSFTDETLFDGVIMLPAGSYLKIDGKSGKLHREIYWDYPLGQQKLKIDEHEASQEVARLLTLAVHRQLASDVSVSTYLSGGLDSGAIAAIASQRIPRLQSFTCGFHLDGVSGLELNFDERAQAQELAGILKTEHYEVILHSGDMENIMPELIWHLEDLRVGQCYPNYYVARLASRFSKVVLSGAGGDELFAGYPWRYRMAHEKDFLSQYYRCWQRLVPDQERPSLFRPSVFMEDFCAREAFEAVLSGFRGDSETLDQKLDMILYFELKTFLHGLLVVEDRLSMAHGLETRVPFLDNDLVDFACQLSPLLKVPQLAELPSALDENDPTRVARLVSRSGEGKTLLRKSLAWLLPAQVVDRPKQGFSGPDACWFRGSSQAYVDGLLGSADARIYEYLSPDYVQQRLLEHAGGQRNHRLFIWSLLSFEWWLRHFL